MTQWPLIKVYILGNFLEDGLGWPIIKRKHNA
jgi:hypothetical protein